MISEINVFVLTETEKYCQQKIEITTKCTKTVDVSLAIDGLGLNEW